MQLRFTFDKAAPEAAPHDEHGFAALRAPPRPEPDERAPAAAAPLFDLIGGRIGSVVSATFRRMEIAEEEITDGRHRHPSRANAIFESFKHLVPPPLLRDLGDELYRLHCRELIERVGKGRDLRPGTAAEVVAALSGLSQIAPPTREQTLLYMKLFDELFPERAAAILRETGPMEPDRYEETRIRELEAEYRRKVGHERGIE